MRWNRTTFRLCASVAAAALLGSAVRPAIAQPSPPLPALPGAPADPAVQNLPDPPARVGRIAAIRGTASFHAQGDTQWSPAAINFPVSTGNAFWTEPSARMTLEVSDSRIAMAGGTEVDVSVLDPNGLQAVAARGEIYLHLQDLSPGEAWSITTPRGVVHLNGPGRFGITVGTIDDPTLVTVLEGSATMDGPDLSLQIGPNQTASVTGRDSFQATVGPAQPDTFLTEAAEAERPPPPPSQVPPAVAQAVAALPGGVDIIGTGTWAEVPDYGQVWYPPVSPGWVPYRQGHWAWVAPWGWTWIDDAPWGFAPFHYGRWIETGGRWGWIPGEPRGPAHHPVYAPALVAFVGLAAGAAAGAALASHSVGWVPLGPREAFRPWYRASPQYVQQVNATHVTNITNNIAVNNFINRGAATSIPASAMIGSRPVAPVAQPIPPQQLAAARPVVGRPPVAPAAGTQGITQAAARMLNVPSAGTRPAAPGPEIRPSSPGPAISRIPGGMGGGGAAPAAARPAGIGMPGAGGAGGAPGTVVIGPHAPGSPMPNGVEPHPGGAPGPEHNVQALPGRPGLPGSVRAGAGSVAPQPQGAGAPPPTGRVPTAGAAVQRPEQQGAPPHSATPAAVPHGATPATQPPAPLVQTPLPSHQNLAVPGHVQAPPPVHVQGPPPPVHVQSPPVQRAEPPPAMMPPHFAAPAAMAPPHFSAPPPAPAPHFAPPPPAPAPHMQAPSPAQHPEGRPRRPGEP